MWPEFQFRPLEFYQLDIEMSFVDLADIQAVGDEIMPNLVREFAPDANVYSEIPVFLSLISG